MTTQIMFKIDSKLKEAVKNKAKREGLTLSDFYKYASRYFVEGKLNFGMIIEEDSWDNYTKESYTSYKRGLKDYKEGRFFRVR
jgi:antitoxin component of RelBE/YafQ-DinJ toxin-antitoxin module